MAATTILGYRQQGGVSEPLVGQIDVFVMDATTKFDVSKKSRVTKHPVEDKSNISDHVIKENTIINIEGVVSNSHGDELGKVPRNEVDQQSTDRVRAAYQYLSLLMNNRTPVTIVGYLESFENCILTNFSAPETSKFSHEHALDLSLTFEQIRTTTVDNVTLFASDFRDEVQRGSQGIKEAVRVFPLEINGVVLPFEGTRTQWLARKEALGQN